MSLEAVVAVVEQQRQTIEVMERELAILRADRNSQPGMKVFAMRGSHAFGRKVAKCLGVDLCPHDERYHPDGELYVRPLVNLRGSMVFIIYSLFSDNKETVNDKLAKLMYMVGACRDAAAEKIVVVVPYLAYARSDRKVKSREPVITKYIAMMLESVGASRIITMDVHCLQAFQNAFRTCIPDNLTARIEFAKFFAHRLADVKPKHISVLSPDVGGFSRANRFRKALMHYLGKGIGIAWLDKQHSDDDSDRKSATTVIGEVRRVMISVDDMIAGGGTSFLGAETAKQQGAEEVWCVATHGLHCGAANDLFLQPAIDHLVLADTIEPFRLKAKVLKKVEIVPTTHLWAEAIRRTYTGSSLSSMLTLE
jgi:ribose-phosphate pyrophosphokinase